MKKAQAALEFLTTYGWAVMMLLIAIGALSYFGVLSPSKFLPERCSFPPEIICEDYELDGSTVTAQIKLRHNFGKTVILESAECIFRGGVTADGGISALSWAPKNSTTVTCTPSGSNLLVRGQKDKIDVKLIYKLKTSGYDHELEGEVYATVK